MSDLVVRDVPLAHELGELGEALGGPFGELGGSKGGPERFGIGKDPPQDAEILGLMETLKVEFQYVFSETSEVGMDNELIHIADDEERRILQIVAVEEQLLVRCFQVFVLALVLPPEMLAHPDIGPAVPAFFLTDAPFKGVPGTLRISLGGLGLSQQFTQIKKVLLAGTAFGERDLLPFIDEFLWAFNWQCSSLSLVSTP